LELTQVYSPGLYSLCMESTHLQKHSAYSRWPS